MIKTHYFLLRQTDEINEIEPYRNTHRIQHIQILNFPQSRQYTLTQTTHPRMTTINITVYHFYWLEVAVPSKNKLLEGMKLYESISISKSTEKGRSRI